MELNFKLYYNDELLLDYNLDASEFNRTYIKLSDKYLNIKQAPQYYENSRDGLKLRLNREITEAEKKALKGSNLDFFELKLINYLEASVIELKNAEIINFFTSMHNEYYDTLEEIYEFYLDHKLEITKANLLKLTKIN